MWTCSSPVPNPQKDLQLRVRTAKFRSLFGAAYGFRERGIFMVPHLLRHGASCFPVSTDGPPHSVALHDKHRVLRAYFKPDPKVETRTISAVR